jgi:hypothetical protein
MFFPMLDIVIAALLIAVVTYVFLQFGDVRDVGDSKLVWQLYIFIVFIIIAGTFLSVSGIYNDFLDMLHNDWSAQMH